MNPQTPPNPNESNQNPLQPSTSGRPAPAVHNPLAVMQPGEEVMCEIHRHPVGMLGVYLASGGILVLLAVLIFILGPSIFSSSDRSQVMAGGGLVFLLISAIILAFVFIANKVYWGNHWVVTSDSITQITQTSLFSKQSAQLSLGNLEDVTSEQNGILAQMFKFGLLKVETAGERSKFMFPYCPNPNYYAQKIIEAREAFELAHHGGKQEPYIAPLAPVSPSAPRPAEQSFEQAAQQHQFGPPPSGPVAPPPAGYPGQSTQQQSSDSENGQEGSEEQAASTTPSAYPDTDQPAGGVSTNTHVK